MTEHRILDRKRVDTTSAYQVLGGGSGLEAARGLEPDEIIAAITAAGLRGRGGAGFPTGVKWQTVAAYRSDSHPTSVVVNGAEGEPGTFKDRAILRVNPYRVLEGALIAALAVGATGVIVGLKRAFEHEIERLDRAISELEAAGWAHVPIRLLLGPSSYLFGEETGLLEVIEGRGPFPRTAPPYRQGIDDPGTAAEDHFAESGGSDSAPTLVDNVETMANVPGILARGPEWFRSVGTAQSPGTIVCTVSGDLPHHGVAEVPMGTTLRELIDLVSPPAEGRGTIIGALPGVSLALIPSSEFDTPLTYEDMQAIGSGLGSAGFIVFDDTTDPVAIAHGAARFLSVESCGQCTPCKGDGLELRDRLDKIRRHEANEKDHEAIPRLLDRVTLGARCYLAQEQQNVIGSLLRLFPAAFDGSTPAGPVSEPLLIAPIVDLVANHFILDENNARKQPDWSFDDVDSGTSPAARKHESVEALFSATPEHEAPESGFMTESEALDSLPQLTALHAAMERALGAVETASEGDVRARLDDLHHEVLVYIDATRRVLYPMVRRFDPDEGDTVADVGDKYGRDTIALIDDLMNGGADSDSAALKKLDSAVRVWFTQHEHRVVSILRAQMDPEALDELDRALAEGREESLVELNPNRGEDLGSVRSES